MSRATLKTLYLYPDRHAILVYEESHRSSGKTVEWVEVAEEYLAGTINFHGEDGDREAFRVVFSGGVLGLLRKAKYVDIWDDNRSNAHKQLGLSLRTVTVCLKDGSFDLHEVSQGDSYITSCDAHVQTKSRTKDVTFSTFEQDAALTSWGWQSLRVAKVHRKQKPEGSGATPQGAWDHAAGYET